MCTQNIQGKGPNIQYHSFQAKGEANNTIIKHFKAKGWTFYLRLYLSAKGEEQRLLFNLGEKAVFLYKIKLYKNTKYIYSYTKIPLSYTKFTL